MFSKNKKNYLYIFALIGQLLIKTSYGQVAPVQNQSYLNPYIYNPAWVGKGDVSQLFVGVKKQWAGVEGSPTIATLTYEKPIENTPASIGVRLVNVTEGPVNGLSSQVTAGYKLETGLESSLYFGMSLGLVYNTFNANALDAPNDPLVQAQNNSAIGFDGGVGLVYETNGLNIGWSMPRFAAPRPFAKQADGQNPYSPWDYMIGSVSYTFEPNLDWKFTPVFLYHLQKGFNNQWEAAFTATYQEKLNLGSIYRQNTGLTLLAGINISDRFAFNYLYSFSSPAAQLPNDSHELVLRVIFGEK